MSQVTPNLTTWKARKDPVLPAGPLLEWIDARPGLMSGWGAHEDKGGPQASAARRVNRLRHGEPLHFATADRICCILGVHPEEIWGDLYWELELPD